MADELFQIEGCSEDRFFTKCKVCGETKESAANFCWGCNRKHIDFLRINDVIVDKDLFYKKIMEFVKNEHPVKYAQLKEDCIIRNEDLPQPFTLGTTK